MYIVTAFTVLYLPCLRSVLSLECHCKSQRSCETFPTSTCSLEGVTDRCQEGWFGPYCQKENVALSRPSSQSSTFPFLRVARFSSLAVDGETRTSNSCSATSPGDASPNWTVALNKTITDRTSQMRLYLADGDEFKYEGLKILVDNQVCFDWSNTTGPPAIADIKCRQPLPGNNVTLQLPYTDRSLTLCEVQIFICSDGWYGEECTKQCRCLNETEICDKITGKCQSGCREGFIGTDCQTPCIDGMYGMRCDSACGQCVNSSICDKITGHCLGGCHGNYEQPYCKGSKNDDSVSAAAIVGTCVGVIVCVAVIVIAVHLLRRRRGYEMDTARRQGSLEPNYAGFEPRREDTYTALTSTTYQNLDQNRTQESNIYENQLMQLAETRLYENT